MSFLAPFYLLAGLAIGLPIVFHMIRKTPQGRQVFSSLMFLTPSPPRMTKRSRIEDWLLLLLRSLVVCLLAMAFARPYFAARSLGDSLQQPAERLVILLDRSASMQRTGYWERALLRVQEILRTVRTHDTLQLLAFDETSQTLISFAEWDQLPPAARVPETLQRVQQLSPGWGGTAIGRQLLEAADLFGDETDAEGSGRRLILISDLQSGAGWDVLQGARWPDRLRVQIENLSQPGESNAAIHLAMEASSPGADFQMRLMNSSNSQKELFRVNWQDDFSASEENETAHEFYLTPGQSRMISVPPPEDSLPVRTLVLSGDDVEFDNTTFLAPQVVRDIHIVFAGNADEDTGPLGLRFFLNPLFPDNSIRKIHLIDWPSSEVSPLLETGAPDWIIVGTELNAAQTQWLVEWIDQGGHVLFVATNPEQAGGLYKLLKLPPVQVTEATVPNYAMLRNVDLSHPVLRPFDDPRFSDFTKLRFWKYRQFHLESIPSARVLFAMEDGSPMLVEIPARKGEVMLLASGWGRSDSGLAVWSKFVPLMNGLLDDASPPTGPTQQRTVGDSILLSELELGTDTVVVRFQSETTVHPRSDTFQFSQPGIYRMAAEENHLATAEAGEVITIAVNLSPEESRTDPYAEELLVAAGVPLTVPDDRQNAEKAQQYQRQLLNQELESHQQWWRWLIIAGLLLLVLETAIAQRRGRIHQSTAQMV